MAAIGLLAAAFACAMLLPTSIFCIYKKHLPKRMVDETVLPFWLAMTCASVLSLLTLAIAAFTAIF